MYNRKVFKSINWVSPADINQIEEISVVNALSHCGGYFIECPKSDYHMTLLIFNSGHILYKASEPKNNTNKNTK